MIMELDAFGALVITSMVMQKHNVNYRNSPDVKR